MCFVLWPLSDTLKHWSMKENLYLAIEVFKTMLFRGHLWVIILPIANFIYLFFLNLKKFLPFLLTNHLLGLIGIHWQCSR